MTASNNDWFDQYNPDHGDDLPCQCGHDYDRHFDSHDGMRHVGCKYCDCGLWLNAHGMPCYYHIETMPVSLKVDAIRDNNAASRRLNLYFTGNQIAPPVGHVDKLHLDASYAMHATTLTTIRFAVRYDGLKVIIP